MPLGESPFMPSAPVLAGVLAVIGIVFLVIGALTTSACGGGFSLVYFGFGIILLGSSAATVGAAPALLAGGIVGAILVAIGLVIQNGACHIFSL
jgi:hypothetical protein